MQNILIFCNKFKCASFCIFFLLQQHEETKSKSSDLILESIIIIIIILLLQFVCLNEIYRLAFVYFIFRFNLIEIKCFKIEKKNF